MASPKVFITGVTGFIGSQVAEALLKVGYPVRLAIRKAEQQQTLEKLFSEHLAQIEFAVVPDITDLDSLREVLGGIEYVCHLASPMPGHGSDFKTGYLEPAVLGTTTILEAAQSLKSIKKVLVMSSVLALIPLGTLESSDISVTDNTGTVFPIDVDMPIPDGFAGHVVKYQSSKILAHQAYRDWVSEHRPTFATASFHPTFVLGPSLVQATAGDISGMNALFWVSLQSDQPKIPPTCVDVRDVAKAFVRALERDLSAGSSSSSSNNSSTGPEYILSGQVFTWDDVVKFVKRDYPNIDVKLNPPFHQRMVADTSRAEKDLGLEWRSMEDLIGSVVDQQLKLQEM
ncbi:hypothetical protein BX600DRAFT_515465 [Xylariales sp. PMI_506]|nr:hypothetical protein BX600DRAFT_515465 [Xylariales sp. PMI_506]